MWSNCLALSVKLLHTSPKILDLDTSMLGRVWKSLPLLAWLWAVDNHQSTNHFMFTMADTTRLIIMCNILLENMLYFSRVTEQLSLLIVAKWSDRTVIADKRSDCVLTLIFLMNQILFSIIQLAKSPLHWLCVISNLFHCLQAISFLWSNIEIQRLDLCIKPH